MGANLTIYCLENITDYFEFERLGHSLMALEGYSMIEPLGGFSDKGRDAVYVDKSQKTTIFAYSVREDWRAKLAEDATKIKKHGHTCEQLVFVTTSDFSAGQRDEAIASVKQDYGWDLHLYGVERLRVLLDVLHPDVKTAHPQIFPPSFLQLQNDYRTSLTRDHLYIIYSSDDVAFAEWLTRRLTSEGYLVWCERFKLLGSDRYPDDSDAAINTRTFKVLGVYSQASLRNSQVIRQTALALRMASNGLDSFLIPMRLDHLKINQLQPDSSPLEFIGFEESWTVGLQLLLEALQAADCPRPLLNGKSVAASAFLDKDVLTRNSEQVVSNCLPIKTIPNAIRRFKAQRAVSTERLELLQHQWAYKTIDPRRFLSFCHPPDDFAKEYSVQLAGGESWRDVQTVEGIKSTDLVVELLRKSLAVKCHERGLRYCPQTFLYYFPTGLVERERLNLFRPDGSKTFVSATGQRKFWRPTGSEEYRYYLAPVFSVAQNLFGEFVALVRIRIRLTDIEGEVLPRMKGVSRRKHLCRGWWNNEWLNRVLAVTHFLAENDNIYLGALAAEQIVFDAKPICMVASEGINEDALDQLSFERSEFLIALEHEDADENSDLQESIDE